MNLVLFKQQLGLEIVDLQAHTAHAISCEKVNVIISTTVARAIQDRLHTPQGFGIFLSCLRLLPRQRFAPFYGGGRASEFVASFSSIFRSSQFTDGDLVSA